MKMNWYYRMILSYAPILFIIISSMIFIFFLVLNNASDKRYIETNQAILDRMVFNTDANLMLIERNVVSMMLTDSPFQNFFAERPKDTYEYFLLQKRLIELSSTLPFSNTIYLYNEEEERLVSDLGSYTPDTFGDYDYLMSNYVRDDSGSWHNSRLFAYSAVDEHKQKVISLMKFYRIGHEKRGALVVNVYEDSLMDYLNMLNDHAFTSIRLLDDTNPYNAPIG